MGGGVALRFVGVIKNWLSCVSCFASLNMVMESMDDADTEIGAL